MLTEMKNLVKSCHELIDSKFCRHLHHKLHSDWVEYLRISGFNQHKEKTTEQPVGAQAETSLMSPCYSRLDLLCLC